MLKYHVHMIKIMYISTACFKSIKAITNSFNNTPSIFYRDIYWKGDELHQIYCLCTT